MQTRGERATNAMTLNEMEKEVRAQEIKRYMEARGIKRAVCFTCGNAAQKLRDAGVEVDAIGPDEKLKTIHWFSAAEIAKTFPEHFNATSGELPMSLMLEIARVMKIRMDIHGMGEMPQTLKVGSGETAIIMALIYGYEARGIGLYRSNTPESEYNDQAPLNKLLEAIWGHTGR